MHVNGVGVGSGLFCWPRVDDGALPRFYRPAGRNEVGLQTACTIQRIIEVGDVSVFRMGQRILESMTPSSGALVDGTPDLQIFESAMGSGPGMLGEYGSAFWRLPGAKALVDGISAAKVSASGKRGELASARGEHLLHFPGLLSIQTKRSFRDSSASLQWPEISVVQVSWRRRAGISITLRETLVFLCQSKMN
jgi:hypothetical protein